MPSPPTGLVAAGGRTAFRFTRTSYLHRIRPVSLPESTCSSSGDRARANRLRKKSRAVVRRVSFLAQSPLASCSRGWTLWSRMPPPFGPSSILPSGRMLVAPLGKGLRARQVRATPGEDTGARSGSARPGVPFDAASAAPGVSTFKTCPGCGPLCPAP